MREELDFGLNYFKPEDFKYTFKCRTTGDVIFRCNKQSVIEVLRDILHIKIEEFRQYYCEMYRIETKLNNNQVVFKRDNQESTSAKELVSYEELIHAFKNYQTKYDIEVN